MSRATPSGWTDVACPSISDDDFTRLAELLEQCCGIQLREGKQMLVRSRLSPRLKDLGLTDIGAYLCRVRNDSAELSRVVDLLTTNKTSLFRETPHFDYLEREILPQLDRTRPFRIWSAGCSTGDEPYSLAMLWAELAPPGCPPPAILATDISSRALARARAGEYVEEQLQELDPARVDRHFLRRADGRHVVRDHARSPVTFARLNLMGRWPMRGPFDLILCRNVMIYFSRQTQQQLVRRFGSLLRDHSHLFIGHAESLGGLDVPFEFVQPAIYHKIAVPRAAGKRQGVPA